VQDDSAARACAHRGETLSRVELAQSLGRRVDQPVSALRSEEAVTRLAAAALVSRLVDHVAQLQPSLRRDQKAV
jgi:hypothetical protein